VQRGFYDCYVRPLEAGDCRIEDRDLGEPLPVAVEICDQRVWAAMPAGDLDALVSVSHFRGLSNCHAVPGSTCKQPRQEAPVLEWTDSAAYFSCGYKHSEVRLDTGATIVSESSFWNQAVVWLDAEQLGADVTDTVPIGAIISWWRPGPAVPIPAGYQVCDGSTITDPASPYVGEQLPDLTDRFIKGVTELALGTRGGSASHAHSITIASAGRHSHSGSADSAGGHSHSVSIGLTGFISNTPTSGSSSPYYVHRKGKWSNNQYIDVNDDHGSTHEGQHRHDIGAVSTSAAGNHTHSVSISSAGAHTHGASIQSMAHEPPYVGLLMLMRVR
jgi:hypothetical protein